MTPAEISAWTARSRQAQGLPAKIVDPVVLDRMAGLVAGVSTGSKLEQVGETKPAPRRRQRAS